MKNPLHIFHRPSSIFLSLLCALCALTLTAQTPLKQSTAATVQISPAVASFFH